MSDLLWLRILFTIALVMWLLASAIFTRVFLLTIIERGCRYPFVVSSVFVGVSNMIEAILYTILVYYSFGHPTLSRILIFYIPIGLGVRALGFIITSRWSMSGEDTTND